MMNDDTYITRMSLCVPQIGCIWLIAGSAFPLGNEPFDAVTAIVSVHLYFVWR